MRFFVLATDFDGTIAEHGRIDAETRAAVEALQRTGRRVILVTGRQLTDLLHICPDLELFDWVVAENGAVIYRPRDRHVRTLAEPPPVGFIEALQARGVSPLSVGRVVVATWEPHENTVLDVIREQGLELQLVFNKGAVMVLPSGINKAYGLAITLALGGYSPHNTIALGDAENDHALLAACESGVAVGNAIDTLKERADHVTLGHNGSGVRVVIDFLIRDEARLIPRPDERNRVALGETDKGETVYLDVYTHPVLIAGPSGSGKSTIATSIIEQLAEREYQFCILDPEGDYRSLPDAIIVGDGHPPDSREVMECLVSTRQNVVVNLLDVPLNDRPILFEGLLGNLLALRARTGRPHWIVVDEAHHMVPHTWHPTDLALPKRLHNVMFLTVHPQHVWAPALAEVKTVLAVGVDPGATMRAFADAAGFKKPHRGGGDLESGHALLWRPGEDKRPVHLKIRSPRVEQRRHARKYAFGELGPDKSFYFRGAEGQLNLRVQNLHLFLQVADGVDNGTWLFHLRNQDYSTWIREAIKDDALADEVEQIEGELVDNAEQSRARIRACIEARYTGPT